MYRLLVPREAIRDTDEFLTFEERHGKYKKKWVKCSRRWNGVRVFSMEGHACKESGIIRRKLDNPNLNKKAQFHLTIVENRLEDLHNQVDKFLLAWDEIHNRFGNPYERAECRKKIVEKLQGSTRRQLETYL